ncbi:lysophospholipase [bacterium]|nr:lysophospholipase [bacterium]MCI0566195.1 lysophospholipase [bacterium]MCI0680042.1 lysophospholipase [bacterium]
MKISKISIPSTKGKLAAVIHYPEKETGRLAILCPGYLDSKDYLHLVSLADALAGRGYTAVRFDPSGTWESEGDISNYTTTQYLRDIKNVLEFMLKRGNYSYIVLGGHSRGGFTSMLYAARDTRISAAVAIMPPYVLMNTVSKDKIDVWKQEGFRISARDVPQSTEKKEFRVPYSDIEDAEKYNCLNEIPNIHAALLLLAGERDNVVLPADVKMIFDRAPEPKKYILLRGVGHDYRRNENEIDIVNKKILEELKPL